MATQAKARLSGRFPAGTKVGLYRDLIGGGLLPADPELGAAIKTQTVGDDQSVEFTGLDDGERLIIGGYVTEDVPRPGEARVRTEWRSVPITAQVPVTESKLSDAKVREALAQTLSADQRIPDRTIMGARDSRSKSAQGQPFAHPDTGKPTESGPPSEATPHLRQEDVGDLEQRSATLTGQATPVDPGEQVPKPAQDGPVDLEQRVATGVGELTPVPQGEVVPGVPQDIDADVEQRVAGESGTQFPVPTGDGVEAQRRKESSAAKAEGAVIPPVGEDPEAVKRSEAAKKAAATRKKNEKKAAPKRSANRRASAGKARDVTGARGTKNTAARRPNR